MEKSAKEPYSTLNQKESMKKYSPDVELEISAHKI